MTNPFDHAPDEQLGRVLRRGLDATAHDDFVRRTLALLATEPVKSSWDVLNAWLRPGVAAAVVLALLFSMWLRLAPSPAVETSLADAVRPANVPASLFSSAQPSNADNLLAAVVEGR